MAQPRGELRMPLDYLKQGILFAMKENLNIQFVLPDTPLLQEYEEVMESIDHTKIASAKSHYAKYADVLVLDNDLRESDELPDDKPCVLRLNKQELFDGVEIVKNLLGRVTRLNVVLTDTDTFTDEDFETYKSVLKVFSDELERLCLDGELPQLNLLTDRMMLAKMNNCGAGESNVVLAPNGRFYVCPAFYYEDENDCIGDLEQGLNIRNQQLYKLDYAPICRHCDAWQCRRCIWLNRKTTLEVNTPSHEQCVVAHLERNASAGLLRSIRRHGIFLSEQPDFLETDYLDPFDKRDTWQ